MDAIAAAAKAQVAAAPQRPRGYAFVPTTLPPTADLTFRRIEEEIRYVQRLVGTLGDTLSDDFLVLQRHETALQQFDLVSQILGHLANVVGTDEREEAVERIGMAELRARLARPDTAMTHEFRGALYRNAHNPAHVHSGG